MSSYLNVSKPIYALWAARHFGFVPTAVSLCHDSIRVNRTDTRPSRAQVILCGGEFAVLEGRAGASGGGLVDSRFVFVCGFA